jgi:hypothetical protein
MSLASGPGRSGFATQDDTVYECDFGGPFLWNDVVGFTDPSTGVTTRNLLWNTTTKAFVALPSDFSVNGKVPYLAWAGTAGDLFNGSTDDTGLTSKNFGSGPDFCHLPCGGFNGL